MVNITKRMHRLMPKIWQVQGGPGAVIMPPRSPKPQLVNVVLRIANPAKGFDDGARMFWRRYLPAVRYHNLTLPIKVEQRMDADSSFAPTMTLTFEATSKEALENQNATPSWTDAQSLKKWQAEVERRHQQAKLAEVQGGPVVQKKENSMADRMRIEQLEAGIPKNHRTKIGEITVKPQAAADPSAPSTTSPPDTVYQREITLGLRGRPAAHIWTWFEELTSARRYFLPKADAKMRERYRKREEKADLDRQRVKAGIDAMRREKAELKKAKEAAERLQAEV